MYTMHVLLFYPCSFRKTDVMDRIILPMVVIPATFFIALISNCKKTCLIFNVNSYHPVNLVKPSGHSLFVQQPDSE